jgi:hypothetical protein
MKIYARKMRCRCCNNGGSFDGEARMQGKFEALMQLFDYFEELDEEPEVEIP